MRQVTFTFAIGEHDRGVTAITFQVDRLLPFEAVKQAQDMLETLWRDSHVDTPIPDDVSVSRRFGTD